MQNEIIKTIHGDDVFKLIDTDATSGHRYLVIHDVDCQDCVIFYQTFETLQEAKYAFYRELLDFEGCFYKEGEEISCDAMLEELK